MQLRLDEWRADIRALELLADPASERLALITALEARMTLSLFASHPEGTHQAGERALILAKTMRRRDVEARIGNILGMHLANLLRRVDQALPMLQDSASFAETTRDGPLLVSALCNLSLAQRLSGTGVAARATAARALALSRSHVAGDAARAARATALHALGSADWYLLNWNDALTALNQAVQDQIDLNNMWRAAEALASLAHLHISMGQYEAALGAVDQLLTLGRGIGVSPESDVWRWVQAIGADVHTLAGNFARADMLLGALDDWLHASEDSRYALIGLQARGRLWLEQHRPDQAMRMLKRAHRIWQQRPHAELEPVLLYALAAHRSGETETAREVLAEATRYAQACDGRLHEVLLGAVTHELCGDRASLAAAYNAVQAQASTLDGAARERFLAEVRLHRDVVQRHQQDQQTHQARLTVAPREVRTVQLARIGMPLGRPLTSDELTPVQWTVDDGDDDALILRRAGKGGLRQHRIQRLVREAADQGAVPTHVDLAEALDVNVRTIERDMLQLSASGVTLLTRRQVAQGRSRNDHS
jgi:tetratricopeptide (TPR) repeat protein